MTTARAGFSSQAHQQAPREESRRFERFALKLTSRIFVMGPGNPVLELVTENISAGGAFFHTRTPLSEGVMLLIELVLKRESGRGRASKVRVAGKVLRSQRDGMAVLFQKGVRMMSY